MFRVGTRKSSKEVMTSCEINTIPVQISITIKPNKVFETTMWLLRQFLPVFITTFQWISKTPWRQLWDYFSWAKGLEPIALHDVMWCEIDYCQGQQHRGNNTLPVMFNMLNLGSYSEEEGLQRALHLYLLYAPPKHPWPQHIRHIFAKS